MKRCVLSKLRVDIEKRNPEAYPGGLRGFAVFTQQGRTQDLGGGGGGQKFIFEIWKFACRKAKGRSMPSREMFLK